MTLLVTLPVKPYNVDPVNPACKNKTCGVATGSIMTLLAMSKSVEPPVVSHMNLPVVEDPVRSA